jgi:predicted transcriptional regulator
MIALRLVRLIEDHSDELVNDLLGKFKSSEHTQDMTKVPEHELRQRVHEILNHLGEWLLDKKEEDVRRRYVELGLRRTSQGVSLTSFCWAMVLTKQHIRDFIARQGFLRGALEMYGELELLQMLDQFFDHALCYAAEGYEQAKQEAAA